LVSLADFRAPSFNLSVTRDGVGLEDEFELLMQLLVTYFNWLRWSLGKRRRISRYRQYRLSDLDSKTRQPAEAYCTQCDVPNTE